MLDAGDPSVVHVQASVSLHSVRMLSMVLCPVLPSISSFVSLSLSRRRLNCFFAICDEQCPVFSLTMLSEATALHYIKGSRELLIGTVYLNFQADIVVSLLVH